MPNEKAIVKSPEQPANQILIPWWHTPVSAAIGGTIGGWLVFSFEGLKKRAQSNQILSRASLHPKELFRGSTSFAASLGVTSAAQFTIQRLLHNLPNYNPESVTWNAATAMASGMCGAFFSTIVENVILQQQLKKSDPATVIKELFKQGYARPWLGLPELMAREGGFALTMLYLAAATGKYIKSRTDNTYPVFAGKIGVGVVGALCTHPFDTMATYKQKNLVSSKIAFNEIFQKNRLAGFYKGAGYRASLFTFGMMVIPKAEEKAGLTLKELSLFSVRPGRDPNILEEKQTTLRNSCV